MVKNESKTKIIEETAESETQISDDAPIEEAFDDAAISQEDFSKILSSIGEEKLSAMLAAAGDNPDEAPVEEETPNSEDVSVEMEAPSSDDAPAEEEISESEGASEEEVFDDDAFIKKKDFGKFLSSIREQDLRFMLATAGEKPDEILGEFSGGKKKSRKKKLGKKKRRLIWGVVFMLEAFIVLLAFNILYNSVTVNSDEELFNSATSTPDKISYSEGVLQVNDVSVKVPTKVNETYDISYSWDQSDTEYPSIPRSVTVSYEGKNKEPKYNLTLYRQDTIAEQDIPEGKDEKTWFDDWNTATENGISQQLLKAGDIQGFYISPDRTKTKSSDDSGYDNYTYYFAVKSDKDIQIYVLEGVCEDETAAKELADVMQKSIQSIKVEKPAKKPAEKDQTENNNPTENESATPA